MKRFRSSARLTGLTALQVFRPRGPSRRASSAESARRSTLPLDVRGSARESPRAPEPCSAGGAPRNGPVTSCATTRRPRGGRPSRAGGGQTLSSGIATTAASRTSGWPCRMASISPSRPGNHGSSPSDPAGRGTNTFRPGSGDQISRPVHWRGPPDRRGSGTSTSALAWSSPVTTHERWTAHEQLADLPGSASRPPRRREDLGMGAGPSDRDRGVSAGPKCGDGVIRADVGLGRAIEVPERAWASTTMRSADAGTGKYLASKEHVAQAREREALHPAGGEELDQRRGDRVPDRDALGIDELRESPRERCEGLGTGTTAAPTAAAPNRSSTDRSKW